MNFELINKYRIVRDRYLGYEVQVKFWYFPIIYFQCHYGGYIQNTFSTLDTAKDFLICKKHGIGCTDKYDKIVYKD